MSLPSENIMYIYIFTLFLYIYNIYICGSIDKNTVSLAIITDPREY